MSQETLTHQFVGGLMISAVIIIHFMFNKFGISPHSVLNGIIHDLTPSCSVFASRLSVLLGMIATSAYMFVYQKSEFPATIPPLTFPGFIVAGLCLGIGAQLAKGGLETQLFQFSAFQNKTGIISSVLMLASGIAFACIEYQLQIFSGSDDIGIKIDPTQGAKVTLYVSGGLFLLYLIYRGFHLNEGKDNILSNIVSFLCGGLLSLALIYSKLTDVNTVTSFLNIQSNFRVEAGITYLTVFLVNLIIFHFLRQNLQVDVGSVVLKGDETKCYIGSIIFGFGLGITGLTLGPIITLFPLMTYQISLTLVPCIIVGYFADYVLSKI